MGNHGNGYKSTSLYVYTTEGARTCAWDSLLLLLLKVMALTVEALTLLISGPFCGSLSCRIGMSLVPVGNRGRYIY